MRICFHLPYHSQDISYIEPVVKYAIFNQRLLHNKSYLAISERDEKKVSVALKNHNIDIEDIELLTYKNIQEFKLLLHKQDVKVIYWMKHGTRDANMITTPLEMKNIVHCADVYDPKRHLHGDIYVPLHPKMNEIEALQPFIPYLPPITELSPIQTKFRDRYGLKDKLIVGVSKASYQYPMLNFLKDIPSNIQFVVDYGRDYKPQRDSRYTGFDVPNIISVDSISEYCSECDAVLCIRSDNSFAYDISKFNCPVLYRFTNNGQGMFLQIAKKPVISFENNSGLKLALERVSKNTMPISDYDFTAEKVMDIFSKLISMKTNHFNYLSCSQYSKYVHFNHTKPKPEDNHLQFLANKLLKSSDIVIEIGAGEGYITQIAKKVRRVIAVEPHPELAKIIELNKLVNNLNNIEIIRNFITEDKKTFPRYTQTTNLKSIYYHDVKDDEYIVEVQAHTLDGLMHHLKVEEKENMSDVRLIRIDVDHEYDVLKGGIGTLNTLRPYFLLKTTSQRTFNLMNAFRYFAYKVEDEYLFAPTEELQFNFQEIDEYRIVRKMIIPKYTTTTIRILGNFDSSENIYRYWRMFSKTGDGRWNNIQLTATGDADYYCIINSTTEKVPPDKSIVMRMEPKQDVDPRWNNWYSSRGDFLFFLEKTHYRNNCEWWLNKTATELQSAFPKTKIISTILSDQTSMIGHKIRTELAKHLEL